MQTSTNTEEIFSHLTNMSNPKNEIRQSAEAALAQLREKSARPLYEGLMQVICTKASEINQCSLACVLIKKFYLDERQSEISLEQLNKEDLIQMKEAISGQMDLTQPMSLLRRKAEILCKLHHKLETYSEIVTMLTQLALKDPSSPDEGIIKGKEIAMFMFDLLSEYYLPQEQIIQNQAEFIKVFQESLKDTQARVRAATFKALTSFLTSIEDEDQVMQYSGMMGEILDIVVEVLKSDEDQGTQALESLIELT